MLLIFLYYNNNTDILILLTKCLVWIKGYCWGAVVVHTVYLLHVLYMWCQGLLCVSVSPYLQDVVMLPCDWLAGHLRQSFFTRAGNGVHRIQNRVYDGGKLKKKEIKHFLMGRL